MTRWAVSELPKGWCSAEIGDLCELINGRAFKPQEWSDVGLPIIRIQNLNNRNASFNHFAGMLSEKHLIKKGDLLFAWSGTPGTSFGAHVWHGNDAALNQHIFKVDFDKASINRNFFLHAINQKLDELIGAAQGGVGLRHVTKGTFEKTEISFPPLAEQARIAQALDGLLAQVDTLKARLDALPALIKRFRQSVLSAAVSGQLTEEWRGNVEYVETDSQISIPNSWTACTIGDVAEVKGGKRLPKGEELTSENTGYPYIRAGQLKDGTVSVDGQLFVPEHVYSQISRYIVSAGDVYVTIVGACIGDAGVIPPRCNGFNLTENAAKICDFKLPIISEYLAFWMRSQHLQQLIKHEIKSGAQGKLALKRIKELPFPCPSCEEQTEIVRRVEQLFTFADQLEAKVATAQTRIDRLTQSILAKAFRGELVPQDPADEPASVLLQRIQTQRANALKAKRGRKALA